MKKFKFKLEALLKLRLREEDSVKEELAQKRSEKVKEEQLFADIKNQLTELQSSSFSERESENSITKLRYSVNFRNRLKLDMLDKARTVEELEKDIWEIQQRLIKATQEKKAIEILREKKLLEWKKENRIAEQNYSDDISGQRYIRKSREVMHVDS